MRTVRTSVFLLVVFTANTFSLTFAQHEANVPMTAAQPDDPRSPLPLLPQMAEHQKQNMRDHLAAIQAIIAGLAHDDLAAVETNARRIGYSDAMARMCNHMGAAAPGFTEMALNFHRTADRIIAAAHEKNREAMLSSLADTLQTCVGCHAKYRQEVVDEETWRKLTGGMRHEAGQDPPS